jgi:hypothetical protein
VQLGVTAAVDAVGVGGGDGDMDGSGALVAVADGAAVAIADGEGDADRAGGVGGPPQATTSSARSGSVSEKARARSGARRVAVMAG